MTRALLVAGFLLATASAAVASPIGIGGYAGLGIGPAGNVDYASSNAVLPDGRSGQVFGGIRFKGTPLASRFSLQASLAFDSFIVNSGIFYDARMVGLAARYNHPLGAGMDLFGKLGVAHTSYKTETQHDADGSQTMLGVGAEYHLPLPVKVSVLVDYTFYRGDIEGDYVGTISGGIGMWMLGFTVGF